MKKRCCFCCAGLSYRKGLVMNEEEYSVAEQMFEPPLDVTVAMQHQDTAHDRCGFKKWDNI